MASGTIDLFEYAGGDDISHRLPRFFSMPFFGGTLPWICRVFLCLFFARGCWDDCDTKEIRSGGKERKKLFALPGDDAISNAHKRENA